MSLHDTLQRHPVFAAELLQWSARLRRLNRLLVATVIAGTALVLALLHSFVDADAALASTAEQWPIVLALSALFVMGHVSRRRRGLAAEAARSWLAAAPIAQLDRRMASAVRIVSPIVALLGMGCTIVMTAARDAAALDAAQRICSSLWGGAFLGSIAGWLAPRRRQGSRYEASRYAPPVKAARRLEPSDRALSHWPIAQAFAWGRPENLRVVIVVCLLLGVQAGTSALHGVLIVASWILAGYLGSLLAAVPSAAQAAARWLRSTPIAVAGLGWALMRRALVHQALGVLLAAVAVSALGSPLRMTLALCTLWVVAVAAIYAASVLRSDR